MPTSLGRFCLFRSALSTIMPGATEFIGLSSQQGLYPLGGELKPPLHSDMQNQRLVTHRQAGYSWGGRVSVPARSGAQVARAEGLER